MQIIVQLFRCDAEHLAGVSVWYETYLYDMISMNSTHLLNTDAAVKWFANGGGNANPTAAVWLLQAVSWNIWKSQREFLARKL